ncbi:DNA invertase Pin-like site-specific DNA recombinase [Massilia aurea]|uniref:DNA invertase Pin-like site-specific DNA recombinase n=1 Tax=Massilia aurea TaxID=373040 RepID=A0A7X0CGH2_9BURK|nr:recombinase family protein [Massilia aurea]MBB6135989.1 DNA invertase Pin-like site-specific DNA recombinase [Massilia aurea]
MTKAYSYIRFSDPSQAKGDSYRRQFEATQRYCKENNLTLVSETAYVFFDEGVSAFDGSLHDDETSLSKFYNFVKEGAIPVGSTLIIESLDRLSRERVRAALPRFLDILNAGINIHTLQSNKTYLHDSTDDYDLFQSILEMSRSHKESLWKSVRLLEAWQNKHNNAATIKLSKVCPAWLDPVYDENDGNLKKKPIGFAPNDFAKAVKKIFQYTIDGYGRETIARMLNEEGINAPRSELGWGSSGIYKVITSISVMGYHQPTTLIEGKRVNRGEPIKNYYPEVIDPDTFEKARAATESRNHHKARKHPPEFQIWQGLATCALCGSRLHSYGTGKKVKGKLIEGNKQRWIRCYSAKRGKCEAVSIRLDKLEPVFKEILAKLNILALVQSSASEINAKLDVVTGKLAAERAKLKRFRGDYATRDSETILSLIYEAEDVVKALEKQEKDYIADLAADQIVDKADFFSRLDLESFTGRSRANSILKRLKVQIGINTSHQRFHIVKDGKPAFDLVLGKEDKIGAMPANHEYSAIIQIQDGTFTPFINNDENDMGDEEYENEGYDTRDGY